MAFSGLCMYMGHTSSINGEDQRGACLQPQKKAMSSNCRTSLVSSLSQLLQDYGHLVMDGTSTLTLLTPVLQHLTRLFEQHLLPRTQSHGFIALPSHPADSTAILQAQFLFDMLQKTPSLKLIHPMNNVVPSDMKVFPFKSLKCLELRFVPLHCLQGLRALYSQLEVLICSKCVTTLEEVLSLCGGDLSSALPWLELHTLNFSYNSIRTLDDSLQLLNVLKVLDLSHNQIEDCGAFLLPLTDLVYLNLSYNFLTKVPLLSLGGGRTPLATLILRSNDLESIDGVEHLTYLQHLDLAFNLLLEHAQLAPLFHLHQLKKLYLEGNPLSFHKDHRPATVQRLSPRAVSENLFLDGHALLAEELVTLPLTGHEAAQSWRVSTPVNNSGSSPLDSSYAADASDSPSAADSGAAKLPRKKSKIKVRKASISEPSDTENANKSKATDVVLHHQQEIARIDSFRDQFGADWLQYRHHLEKEMNGTAKVTPVVNERCLPPDVTDSGAPSAMPTENTDPEQDKTQGLFMGSLLLSRDATDQDRSQTEVNMPPLLDIPEKHGKRRRREALHKKEKAKSKITEGKKHEEDRKEEKKNEEKLDIEGDVCDPIVVCPFLGKDPSETEDDWIFLRVTRKYLIEVDLSNGQDMRKMELISLLNIETSEVCWKMKDEDKMLPLLQLQFDSIRTDKQRFSYVVLDDSAEISIKTILQILYPVLEANLCRIKQRSEESVKLQCLKCRKEFNQPPNFLPVGYSSGEEKDVMKEACAGLDENAATPAECPSCASDHVIILPSGYEREERLSSTPVSSVHLSSDELVKETTSIPPSVDHIQQPDLSSSSASVVQPDDGSGRLHLGKKQEGSDVNTTSSSGKSKERSIEDDVYGTFHSSSRSSETDRVKSHETKSRAASVGHSSCSLTGSYCYGTPRGQSPTSPPPEPEEEETFYLSPPKNGMVGKQSFRLVDHRLKLYLDVEVLEDNLEEFQCSLQVPVVEFGKDGEFLALVVISERRLYMMEITAEVRGPPSRWLQKRATHQLTSLTHLEFGLHRQVLHLEFDNPLTSYSLLIRNRMCCVNFCECLQDIVYDLSREHRYRFSEVREEKLHHRHRLCPILSEMQVVDKPNISAQSDYFYLLVYIAQEGPISPGTSDGSAKAVDSAEDDCDLVPGMTLAKAMIKGTLKGSPVTLLISNTTICVVEETHQWVYTPPPVLEAVDHGDPSGGEASLKEKHQISCVSSMHLFERAECHVQIRLYDETTKRETIWHLRSSCPYLVESLVKRIRVPWEKMFYIKFNLVTHELLGL